jgi:DNA-binding transcriptional MerR regulator
MKSMDIGVLSDRSGLAPSALRYYEEIGLIALGKAAGFSLPEIAQMLGAGSAPDLPRADLRARADGLDRQIRNLTALSQTMRHVADCRAPSHLQCPTFRRLLKIAARRGMAAGRRSRAAKSK